MKRSTRHTRILFGVGVFVLVVGIIGVVVSSVKWTQDETKTLKHGRFGIVFDAGGTGTRMYVYEYKNDNDVSQALVEKCEPNGLSNYGSDTTALAPLLMKCIQDAQDKVPQDVTKSTPVLMKATAGMRKLKLRNETEYMKIWEEVRKILRNGSFPVKIADTMSGRMEAVNSWTTINDMLGEKNTRGLMEVGSTSLQIAFVPNNNTENIPANMTAEVSLNGKKYLIYATSYLCFGKDEFRRRYYAKLVQESEYNTTGIDDPCSVKEDVFNVTSKYLWEKPCVQGNFAEEFLGGSINGKENISQYTINGIGNYSACKTRVSHMFNNTCTHVQKQCGINNVFQPHTYGKYLAIGGAAYYAADFLQLPQHFNRSIFEEKLRQVCNSTVKQMENRTGYGEFSLTYCLSNSLTLYMLEHIINVNMTIPDGFMFKNKINDKKVSWTLGYVINNKDQLSPETYTTTKEMSDETYTALAVVFGVIICVGVILIIVVLVKRHKVESQSY